MVDYNRGVLVPVSKTSIAGLIQTLNTIKATSSVSRFKGAEKPCMNASEWRNYIYFAN
jgi:hypothetical protein